MSKITTVNSIAPPTNMQGDTGVNPAVTSEVSKNSAERSDKTAKSKDTSESESFSKKLEDVAKGEQPTEQSVQTQEGDAPQETLQGDAIAGTVPVVVVNEQIPILPVLEQAAQTDQLPTQVVVQQVIPNVEQLQMSDEQAQAMAAALQGADVEEPVSQNMVFARQVVQEMQRAIENANAATNAESILEQSGEVVKAVGAQEAGDSLVGQDTKQQTTEKTAIKTIDISLEQAQTQGQFKLEQPMTIEQEAKVIEIKETLLSKIIDQIGTSVTTEKTELYIQLKPAHLGGLAISLAMTEKGLEAKMYSNNQDVQNMLAQEMQTLQQTLREKGINVVSMEIIYDQMSNTAGRDQSKREQDQWEDGNSSATSNAPITIDLTEEIAGYPELFSDDSSVEYTA